MLAHKTTLLFTGVPPVGAGPAVVCLPLSRNVFAFWGETRSFVLKSATPLTPRCNQYGEARECNNTGSASSHAQMHRLSTIPTVQLPSTTRHALPAKQFVLCIS